MTPAAAPVRSRLRVGEVTLAMREWGTGPPVLALHGFPESGLTWAPLVGALTAAGRRVVAPDLRGHGASEAPRTARGYRPARLVGDVIALIERLGPPVDVIGHDWGGGLTWHLLDRRPDLVRRAVVVNAPHPRALFDAIARDRDQRRRSWYVLAAQLPWLPERTLRRDDHAALAALVRATHTPDEIEELREGWRRPGVVRGMLHWYRAAARDHVVHVGRRPPVGAGHVPLLVVWGAADPVFDADVLRRSLAIRPAHVVELPGVGHAPHREAPDRVAELVLAHLDAPPPTGAL